MDCGWLSGRRGVWQISCPPISCGVSDFRDAVSDVADTGEANQTGSRDNTSGPVGSDADGVSGTGVSRERVMEAPILNVASKYYI